MGERPAAGSDTLAQDMSARRIYLGQEAWKAHLPAKVDADALDLLAEASLPAAWSRCWALDPDRAVLHDQAGGWVSAGELDRTSRKVASFLHAAGLRPGERVLFSANPSIDLVIAYLGALRMGLVAVPANPEYREREMVHIVRDASPAAAFVEDGEQKAWVAAASESDVLVFGAGSDLPDRSCPELDAQSPEDPALICYTSGTTGAPKGAVLSHGNLLASAEAVRLAWRWSESDRLVLALPLFHVHGLCVGLHGTLLSGGSAVLLPRFNPEAVLDALESHGATLFFGVPTMYHRLARSPRVGELARLRLLVSGSAPLPVALWERIEKLTGQAVLERYGMTETLMNVSNPYEGERRPGSVGFPLPGVELCMESAEGAEILLRGPNVFGSYWANPGATAEAFGEDGWFRSGDIGRVDPDGYLWIEGRGSELIITGGYNVYPREVEEVLAAHPVVAEVAVVGSPSEEWGEVVTAYVVPAADPPDPEVLLAHAARHLAPYKRPRILRYLQALPRNALGKVQRHELGG
jgi:malonyl-CoA/methylmalonyl-CoA synthetase